METLEEIKSFITGAQITRPNYVERTQAEMRMVSILYRTVYDIETYWRTRTGAVIPMSKGAKFYIDIISLPAMEWSFKIEGDELVATNMSGSQKVKISVPLDYYRDRDSYLECHCLEMLDMASRELVNRKKENARKIVVLERENESIDAHLADVKEMYEFKGRKADELF